MKTFIRFTITAAALVIAVSSCNSRKSVMKALVAECLNAPSSMKVVGFGVSDTITLADEVKERVEYFEFNRSSDSSSVATYEELLEIQKELNKLIGSTNVSHEEENLANARKELEKTNAMLEHLKSIETLYPEIYNKPSYVEYYLDYDANNAYNVPLRHRAIGRFDLDGKIVSLRPDREESNILIGNYFSIPGYYDHL